MSMMLTSEAILDKVTRAFAPYHVVAELQDYHSKLGFRVYDNELAVTESTVGEHNYTADQLEDILYKQSGLAGVSGISSDMREILAAIGRGDSRASPRDDRAAVLALLFRRGARVAVCA